MKGLLLLSLVALFANEIVVAEPRPVARTGEVEVPLVPETEKELKTWLEGTKWSTIDQTRQACIFLGNRFETPLAKPSFTVTGRRAILMNWGNGVKVRCIFDEDFMTMREVDGLKVAYKFEGRKAGETKRNRLDRVKK